MIALCAGALFATLLVAPPAVAKPPSNPGDGSIAKAKAAKAQAAKDVGRLSGLISAIDTKINVLDDKAAFAKQQYDKALWDLQMAKTKATKAKATVAKAQASVTKARTSFQQFLRASFMRGGVDASGLLTSSDPSGLLMRGDMTDYASRHQLDGLGALNRASVAKSNADAAARLAVSNEIAATKHAAIAMKAAVNALETAKNQRAALGKQKAVYQKQLMDAGMKLTGLLNRRAAYNKWHAQQVALAKAAAARKAAALRKALGGSHGNPNPSGSAAPRGVWTAAKGEAAVAAARRWLGTPYAWDGGSYSGPTYGACIDAVTTYYGDCHKIGFDCSGLTMYAWAQEGIYTTHYAPSQWSMGSYHPGPSELMPGDLILYAYNGYHGNAHHVTMYIGGGRMIEAPQSGSYVMISPLRLGEWAGAIRPGS